MQESDFARPDGEIKAGGRVRCALQACEHREMSNYGREAEFFARTDPADSRNVESQRGLLHECGLVGTLLLNLNISTNQYDMYRFMSFS